MIGASVLGETARCPSLRASRIGSTSCPWPRNARHGQGTAGLPSRRQFEAWVAPIGESGSGCPYHPLLSCRPAADGDDPMGVVSVDEGDMLWVSGPAWVDLANLVRQRTHVLQQCLPLSRGPSARRKP